MSVASKVKEFIETCSFLEEFEKATFSVVNLNLLEENPTMYSIEETPADPIVKRFANGDSVRQYVFSLCSRELYGPAENEETAEFYEKFSDWLEECTGREASCFEWECGKQGDPGNDKRVSV